jgi:hypothetical protein
VAGLTLRYVGDLAENKWVSLVASTLNTNEPCSSATIAAATADSTHTGAVRAPANSRTVTIPQSTLLSETTPWFAVCYAETDGTTSDATWRDSWVRYAISQVRSVSVTSGGLEPSLTFSTFGHVAKAPSPALTP